jgi:hypothetical protein
VLNLDPNRSRNNVPIPKLFFVDVEGVNLRESPNEEKSLLYAAKWGHEAAVNYFVAVESISTPIALDAHLYHKRHWTVMKQCQITPRR